MGNPSTDPTPVTTSTFTPSPTNPNTANAPLASGIRANFGTSTRIPSTPTPITPVRGGRR